MTARTGRHHAYIHVAAHHYDLAEQLIVDRWGLSCLDCALHLETDDHDESFDHLARLKVEHNRLRLTAAHHPDRQETA